MVLMNFCRSRIFFLLRAKKASCKVKILGKLFQNPRINSHNGKKIDVLEPKKSIIHKGLRFLDWILRCFRQIKINYYVYSDAPIDITNCANTSSISLG